MARGREAENPSDIPAKGWKDIAWRLKDELAADHVGLIAAGVAFYGLLALFPAITALLAIGGLIVEPSEVVDAVTAMKAIVPDQAMEIILTQAREVAGSHEGGLGLTALVGLLVAIYSASKGVGSLIEGMNVAYDENEERGFVRKTLVVLGLTVMMIIGALAAGFAVVLVPTVLSFVSLGVFAEAAAAVASVALLCVLLMGGLAVLYRYGPSRDGAEFQWVSPGAVAAVIMWGLGSVGFAIYVANFATYNESFGALAGVIVLLMWLWISAFVILLGAELNAEIEAQTRHDTTKGPDQPMGARDAEKADRLGEAHA